MGQERQRSMPLGLSLIARLRAASRQQQMVTGVGITDTIKSLSDLQVRCNLAQADSDRFFSEWIEDLPDLDERELAGIERLKQRYDYHRFDGLLLEGTINLVVVSPLLELAGFLDPPFRLRSPYGIALELDDPKETIRGCPRRFPYMFCPITTSS